MSLSPIKQLLREFSQDKVGQLSAAFAYGAIFSIGPLLLVVISTISFIFGTQAVEGRLFSEIAGTVGAETAKIIQDAVASTHQSGSGITAFVIGTAGLLIGAAGITSQMQSSFNSILGVVPDPKGGIKRAIYVKLKNILLVLLGGIAVAASVIASTIIVGLGEKIQEELGTPALVLELLNNVASLAVLVMILYLVYRVLPDVRIPRRLVLKAAVGVALLFLFGKIVLGIIIGNNGTASAYGAAASLVTLLLWVYYSGQILFIGAEGIKIYGQNHSLAFRPKKYNLKRTTLHIDSDSFRGRLIEAWARGFQRKSRK